MSRLPFIVFSRGEQAPAVHSVAYPIPEDIRLAHPFRLSINWGYQMQANGLPAEGGLQEISNLEAQLQAQLASVSAIFVGHRLSGGRVMCVFYARDAAPRSVSIKTGLLTKRSFDIHAERDPDWRLYREHLEPTKGEVVWQKALMVQLVLRKQGDRHEIPRIVDFTVVLPDQDAAQTALAEAEAAGFTHSPDPNSDPLVLELQRQTAVTREALVPQLIALTSLAEKHGGTFDGWGSPIAR